MKKFIILPLFLSVFSLGFSNSAPSSIISNSWRCTSLTNTINGLIYVKFFNENDKTYLSFNRTDTRKLLKTGVAEVHAFNLNFEVKENEKSIYFTDLDENSNYLSNFKLAYSFDKKNRPKLSLIRISDNKNVCDFRND